MQKAFVTLYLLLSSLLTTGQTKKISSLSIGDTIRMVSLKSKFHNKITRIDLRGKLTILDFWNVWCSSCIEAMQKMDSLQKEFAGRVQIVLVTNNSEEAVNQLFKRTSVKRPALVFINNDKMLHQLFPHNTVPHHVWINNRGKILQITPGLYTTNKNIQATLDGKQLQLPVKTEVADFNIDQSLLLEGQGRLIKHLTAYSIFMNQLSEYGGGIMNITRDSSRQTIGMKIINSSLISLYRTAFGRSLQSTDFDADNRVILETGNKQTMLSSVNSLPEKFQHLNNSYCYESLLPDNKQEDLYPLMQKDLNSFFEYSVSVKKLRMKCMALVRNNQEDFPRIKGEKRSMSDRKDDFTLSIRNQSLDKSFAFPLIYYNRRLSTPVINNTNYKGKVDMDIKSRLDDLPALRIELQKYGLDLVEIEQEIEMLVITEKD